MPTPKISPTDAKNVYPNIQNIVAAQVDTNTEAIEALAGAAGGHIDSFTFPRLRRVATIADMSSGHGWVKGTSGTQVDDTTEFAISDQSVKLTVPESTVVFTRKTSLTPFNASAGFVGVWIKCDSIFKLTELTMYLSSDNFGGAWKIVQLDAYGGTARYTAANEWNLIVFSQEDAVSTSGTPDMTAINSVQVRATGGTSGESTFWVGGLATFEKATEYPNGVVSITFDDCWKSQDTLARPLMEKYGYTPTNYVIVGELGTTNKQTLNDLYRLRDLNGWDIAGHAFSSAAHTNRYHTLTADELEEEVSSLANWLSNHGFTRQLAYPGGSWTPEILRVVEKYFQSARTITSATKEVPRPVNTPKLRAVTGVGGASGGTSVAATKTAIDKAYDGGGWLILAFHVIIEGSTAETVTTQCNEANFEEIMDYLNTKGIDVRTVSEVLHGN